MQNIAELNPDQRFSLARALTTADALGKSVRISTGVDQHGPFVQWSIGQGMWTPPQYTAWVE